MSTADNKPAPQDWPSHLILYHLREAGWTLRRLSQHHGYAPTSLNRVADKPWPKAEAFIAQAVGVPPQTIWPSRYWPDGRPKSGRNERGLGRPGSKKKSIGTAGKRNVTEREVA